MWKNVGLSGLFINEEFTVQKVQISCLKEVFNILEIDSAIQKTNN